MQARQQQQQESAQPQQQQLGNPDLQKNIIDHLHGKHELIFVITAHGQHLATHHHCVFSIQTFRAATSVCTCISDSTASLEMLTLCCVQNGAHDLKYGLLCEVTLTLPMLMYICISLPVRMYIM